MTPLQIRSKLYRSCIVVAIGGADSHRLNLINTSHLVYDYMNGLYRSCHIILHVIIGLCLNNSSSLDLATAVYDTKYRVRASQIQTDYIRFQFNVSFHFLCSVSFLVIRIFLRKGKEKARLHKEYSRLFCLSAWFFRSPTRFFQ